MIELKIYTDGVTPGGGVLTYRDITDLEIDARSCSGVGFASQEARMAELELEMDSWLESEIVNGVDIGMNYLGYPAEIVRDGHLIFFGFMKRDCDIIRESRAVRVVRIRIYDILWIMLDYAEGKVRQLTEGETIYPAVALREWLTWLLGEMPEMIRGKIEIVNEYEPLAWAPYYAPGEAIFEWDSEAIFEPELADVKRRSIVIYEDAGELYFEYCLHDTLTFVVGVGYYITPTHYQHLVWRKYRITDLVMGTKELVEENDVYHISDDGELADSSPETVAEWVAKLDSIVDLYPVMPESGIDTIEYDGVVYLVRGKGLYLNYHPNEAVFVGDGDTENEDSIYDVDMMSFIEDMTKLLCAWLDADGMMLRIKNRMVLPAESGYSIPEDLVVSFRRSRADISSMSMDLSYLVNGDLMREGVEEYYNEMFRERLPYSFELEVILDGHEYRVGEVVDYDGWIIMITEIDEDVVYRRDAQLRGVGGAL